MRIPSDFNDENLYRRRNERKDTDLGSSKSRRSPISSRVAGLDRTTATRRLLRLIVGLVLVIFLMRHAARPENYQAFFAEPVPMVPTGLAEGQPFSRESRAQASSSSITSDKRINGDLYSKNSPQFRDSVRLVEMLSADETRAIVFGLQNAPQSEVSEPLAVAIDKLAESLDPLEAPVSDWLAFAKNLRSSPQIAELDESSDENRRLYAAIRFAALDSALERVVDGSVWRGNDLDAFYGVMIQRDLIPSFDHVQTGVLPMLQQPDVYRGKGVTVLGKVVRGEQLDAIPSAAPIGKYWQLWLRPSDGSERPIVAVVAELPAELAEMLTSENDAEIISLSKAPQVQIDGVYLKRLAYRSSEGAELAPVVVGVVAAMSGAATTIMVGPTLAEPTVSMSQSSLLMLALTAVFGVLIAAVVMLRSHRESARLRLLRSQQQSKTISLPHLLDQANGASEDSDHD